MALTAFMYFWPFLAQGFLFDQNPLTGESVVHSFFILEK